MHPPFGGNVYPVPYPNRVGDWVWGRGEAPPVKGQSHDANRQDTLRRRVVLDLVLLKKIMKIENK